jgi:meiotically up-regulated gene 157 (Mug157) protein
MVKTLFLGWWQLSVAVVFTAVTIMLVINSIDSSKGALFYVVERRPGIPIARETVHVHRDMPHVRSAFYEFDSQPEAEQRPQQAPSSSQEKSQSQNQGQSQSQSQSQGQQQPETSGNSQGGNITTEPPGVGGSSSSCPNYVDYACEKHEPYSSGPLKLPYQRPEESCRSFTSPLVETVIKTFNEKIEDRDLARLFENCFPNTLDTTIRWHKEKSDKDVPQTFVVTGDITAEWIRDAQRQLSPYQPLAVRDDKLKSLLLGAIHTQAKFVNKAPYCNAFNPPEDSGIEAEDNRQNDIVFPPFDERYVFECKYELDSIASFFSLANEYYSATQDSSFVTDEWKEAVKNLLQVIEEQSITTFDSNGTALPAKYSFKRKTEQSTETQSLSGEGNPVNANTGLVRSYFRPSDDATIFQFFIPANAQLAVDAKRASKMIKESGKDSDGIADKLNEIGKRVEKGVWDYGKVHHREFGDVFAYEVDGYGSVLNIDDANLPSLLALSDIGFVNRDNSVYQNTRKMVLSKRGNPYYLRGEYFEGIGGPHAGIKNAWPLSHMLRIRSSDDDDEIKKSLDILKGSTAGLGLMHESIHVDVPLDNKSFTRPWFAWANSEFGKTILDLAERKPHIIFKKNDQSPLKLSNIIQKFRPNIPDPKQKVLL